ncbi:MAG TPA: hypothetical protein VND64_12790 [Pirellulales bacterium]|nr:hypothetical protein [Pirellulales bacterium]
MWFDKPIYQLLRRSAKSNGLLLLLGAASRVVTIPLIITMFVAYSTQHIDELRTLWTIKESDGPGLADSGGGRRGLARRDPRAVELQPAEECRFSSAT